MELNEFWRLQKAADLSNAQAAEYLGVNKSTIVRWRNGSVSVPKAVILALKAYIKEEE